MMGRYREALRTAIASESKAYGFTLVIWSGGALAMAEHGAPGVLGALAYLGGALVAMGLVVLASFGGPTGTWRARTLPRYAFGAVHVASVMLAVLVSWGVAAVVRLHAPAFLAAGFAGALLYQLLLGAEVAFSIAGEPPESRRDTDGAPPASPVRGRE
jgi:hypothetical protein